MRRRSEWRQNLIAVGIMLGVVAIIAAFSYRPATIVGVDGGSLARAVGDEGDCKDLGDRLWHCSVTTGSNDSSDAVYLVRTRFFGCWDARESAKGRKKEPQGKPDLTGCITILDML
jgi:hypothetical protein